MWCFSQKKPRMIGRYNKNIKGLFGGTSKTIHEFSERIEITNKLKSINNLAKYFTGSINALADASNIINGTVGLISNTATIPTIENEPKLKMLIGRQHI
jgi:hypothetical protein